jgi:hypothetical protein
MCTPDPCDDSAMEGLALSGMQSAFVEDDSDATLGMVIKEPIDFSDDLGWNHAKFPRP